MTWTVTYITRCGCSRVERRTEITRLIVVPIPRPPGFVLDDALANEAIARREFRLRSYDPVEQTALYEEV